MRVIKKYSNRRLYDTTASRYVNLDELGALVRSGEEVQVLDASSGDDLTRVLLLQVLIETSGGADLFPIGLLHRIIRTRGDSPAQRAALQQLAMGLELLDGQVTRFERQFGWVLPDFAPPFMAHSPSGEYHVPPRAAAPPPKPPSEAAPPPEPAPPPARPRAAPKTPPAAPPPPPPAPAPATPALGPVDDELEALRERLASLEGRLRGGR